MANNIEFSPELKRQLSELLIEQFKNVSESLSKEITEKAIAVASKKTELSINDASKKGSFFAPIKKYLEKNQEKYDIKQNLKERGIFGLAKDFFSGQKKPKELDLIKDEEKPQKVLIDGITESGLRDLTEKLPSIIKEGLSGLKTEKKEEEKTRFGENGILSLLGPGLLGVLKGALMAGGGVALLLGGLAALITGLQTEGPWKGTLKILSRIGLEGGLALLKRGATKFIENGKMVTEAVFKILDKIKGFLEWPINMFKRAKNLLLRPFGVLKNAGETLVKKTMEMINVPLNFLRNIGDSIMGIFGKGTSAGKVVGTIGRVLSSAKGIFKIILQRVGKIFTMGFLKRIPIIGTIIGLGFAWSRFKSGDTVGGIIDVLSALASMIPVAGTFISIGLDVFNAFLDHKAGGSSEEASKKKTAMIGDFFGNIMNWVSEKMSKMFSWFTDLGGKFLKGDWGDALVQIMDIIPGMDWILELFGTDKKEIQDTVNNIGNKSTDVIGNLMKWMKESIWNKVTGFADNLVGGVKDWWNSVVNRWDGENTTTTPPSPKNKPSQAELDEIPLAKGGIVTGPTRALIGEAGPEAVVPLDQYVSPDSKINSSLLSNIVSNTLQTNSEIKNLSNAIFYLADIFNQKQNTNNNILLTTQSQKSQDPTAAQMSATNQDPIRMVRMKFAV